MKQSFKDYFRQTFLDALGKRLSSQAPEPAPALCAEIDREAAALISKEPQWISDEASKTHLLTTALALAAYRRLGEIIPARAGVLDVIRFAFLEPARRMIPQTKEVLARAKDDFAFAVNASKDKEANFYGRTFVFERERDDDRDYRVNVRKCFYHDYFTAHGVPELTAVFCEWDNVMGNIVAAGDYGFVFERPETLGFGGEMCRFRFQKK